MGNIISKLLCDVGIDLFCDSEDGTITNAPKAPESHGRNDCVNHREFLAGDSCYVRYDEGSGRCRDKGWLADIVRDSDVVQDSPLNLYNTWKSEFRCDGGYAGENFDCFDLRAIKECDSGPFFKGASLKGARFLTHGYLSRGNFEGADMSSAQLSSKGDETELVIAEMNFERSKLVSADISGVSFNGCNFRLADLRNVKAEGTEFYGSHFDSASLDGANLKKAQFGVGNTFNAWTSFANADLSGAEFREVDLSRVSFAGAKLLKADFIRAKLWKADFSRADLTGAELCNNLTDADLRGATLVDANLEFCNISGADLTGAKLSGAKLRGCIYSRKTKLPFDDAVAGQYGMIKALDPADPIACDGIYDEMPIVASGEFSTDRPCIGKNGPKFLRAQFTGFKLKKGSVLQGANFTEADLEESSFEGSDLRSTIFFSAKLYRANLRGCDLRSADFMGAKVESAQFEGAKFDAHTQLPFQRKEAISKGMTFVFEPPLSCSGNYEQADFSWLDLSSFPRCSAPISFSGANLIGTKFSHKNVFSRGDFSNADMRHARLIGVDLTAADLRGAKLGGADLSRCKLGSANLTGAIFNAETKLPFDRAIGKARGMIFQEIDPELVAISDGEVDPDRCQSMLERSVDKSFDPIDISILQSSPMCEPKDVAALVNGVADRMLASDISIVALFEKLPLVVAEGLIDRLIDRACEKGGSGADYIAASRYFDKLGDEVWLKFAERGVDPFLDTEVHEADIAAFLAPSGKRRYSQSIEQKLLIKAETPSEYLAAVRQIRSFSLDGVQGVGRKVMLKSSLQRFLAMNPTEATLLQAVELDDSFVDERIVDKIETLDGYFKIVTKGRVDLLLHHSKTDDKQKTVTHIMEAYLRIDPKMESFARSKALFDGYDRLLSDYLANRLGRMSDPADFVVAVKGRVLSDYYLSGYVSNFLSLSPTPDQIIEVGGILKGVFSRAFALPDFMKAMASVKSADKFLQLASYVSREMRDGEYKGSDKDGVLKRFLSLQPTFDELYKFSQLSFCDREKFNTELQAFIGGKARSSTSFDEYNALLRASIKGFGSSGSDAIFGKDGEALFDRLKPSFADLISTMKILRANQITPPRWLMRRALKGSNGPKEYMRAAELVRDPLILRIYLKHFLKMNPTRDEFAELQKIYLAAAKLKVEVK